MLKNKFIKVTVSVFLLLMALWVATPKVYIHELLHHNHTTLQIGNEPQVQSQSADDCDFNEYNKPVYFNLFKFISSFIPLKPQNTLQHVEKAISLSNISYAISLLRGPPVSE
jgi:hypothetical protein